MSKQLMICPMGKDGRCVGGRLNGKKCGFAIPHDKTEGCKNGGGNDCPPCVPVAPPAAQTDRPTPRTDELALRYGGLPYLRMIVELHPHFQDYIDMLESFAQLERELAESKNRSDLLMVANKNANSIIGANCNELQAIIEKLERELAEALERVRELEGKVRLMGGHG